MRFALRVRFFGVAASENPAKPILNTTSRTTVIFFMEPLPWAFFATLTRDAWKRRFLSGNTTATSISSRVPRGSVVPMKDEYPGANFWFRAVRGTRHAVQVATAETDAGGGVANRRRAGRACGEATQGRRTASCLYI